MTQRFIKLGKGYSDVFELFTLIEAMPERVKHLIAFHTVKDGKEVTSIAAIFEPTKTGNFQPIYICLEGIPRTTKTRSEEHTSELQSRENLVCRLLLEKKTPLM